ncbi:hypothetical protein PsorP6_014290 [Peronosclerospora sorghi]|uniref:Uncharacterized protein n=1 Tax=Peronosclerospora sorghi TaxID=230839 RepID=A0ACC0VJ86_9STRA|nr:hypothetical protein PsorP6_014290 [Peronosclerospora sorghi]
MTDVTAFERAVVLAFQCAGAHAHDPATLHLKHEAERFCAAVKTQRDSWRADLQLLHHSTLEHVQFYALQALQDVVTHAVDDDVALSIRTDLLTWLERHGASLATNGAYLKTKVAVVLTRLITRDFPDRWPTAFTDLLALLPLGAALVELYFRILGTIHEEIVEVDVHRTSADEAARNMKVKDAMREGTCMRESMDAMTRVLVHANASDVMQRLSASALETLEKYISWVDLTLVVNDTLWPVLIQLVRESNALRCAAAHCLVEIMEKGMTPDKKLALLQQVQVLELVASLSIQDDEAFAAAMGQVVNAVGMELVACMDAFRQPSHRASLEASGRLLHQVMPLVWQFFAHDAMDVSEQVFELVNAVGGPLLRVETQGQHDVFRPSEYLAPLLHGLYLQTRLPQAPDAHDAPAFEAYRRRLYTIFLHLVRQRPHETLAFLTNLAHTLPPHVNDRTSRELESFLSLVYRFKEGLASLKAAALPFYAPTSPLSCLVVQLHRHVLGAARHATAPLPPAVVLAYYDVVVRYTHVLTNEEGSSTSTSSSSSSSTWLAAVLDLMFGVHGLAHPDARVRARVCYLCLRLVKAMGAGMTPHASSLLTALQPLLVVHDASVPSPRVTHEDQVYLFEVAGELIASLDVAPRGMDVMALRAQYTVTVLDPLVQELHAACTKSVATREDRELMVDACALRLTAMAHVLKAFKGTACLTQQEETVLQVLHAASCALCALADAPRVRSKVIFTLHRVLPLLARDCFLAHVPSMLETLLLRCTTQDVVEVVQLVDQLILKYKHALGAFLDSTFLPFVQHVCALMPPRAPTRSETTIKDAAQLERDATLKYLLTFVLHVVTHGLDRVLLSARNGGHVDNILLLVLEGCAAVADASCNRIGFAIGRVLVERWMREDDGASSEAAHACAADLGADTRTRFTHVAVHEFTRAMFHVTQQSHLALDEMETIVTLKEIAQLQAALVASSCGKDYVTYLRDVFLPSIGCPVDGARAYTEQVASGEWQKIQAAFKTLVQHLRQMMM